MPIDVLPGEISLPTREEEIARWKRNYRLRVPDADVGVGTQPDVDARVCTDALMPIFASAKVIGKNSVLEEARGKALDQWGEREGVDPKRGAVGATGYVYANTSTGGGTLQAGDELIHDDTGQLFYAITNGYYTNGKKVAIAGKSTGSETNLAAGTQLRWTSARPGFSPTTTVVEQLDGSGLIGGHPAETEEEFQQRILLEKRTRAASGNDAEYQITAEATPTVAVQKCFTYPAIIGTSTKAVCVTLRPAVSGGSRAPTPLQLSLVEAYVVSEMPGDDGAIFCALLEEDADIVYRVSWTEDAIGWADVSQWPSYYEESPASGPGAIVVQSASSATSFILKTSNNNYTGVVQPVAGQTIGFYDAANFTFRSKRILSVTGTGPWTIAVDTTNDVSDETFTPAVGDRAMPWSDSLSNLLPGVFAYFDSLGPGEQVPTFYDEGVRQRRSPRPASALWPSSITTKGLVVAITADTVADVTPVEGDGLSPSVGTAGVNSYILKLNRISFFPEA